LRFVGKTGGKYGNEAGEGSRRDETTGAICRFEFPMESELKSECAAVADRTLHKSDPIPSLCPSLIKQTVSPKKSFKLRTF
jgi:hypothetical protein